MLLQALNLTKGLRCCLGMQLVPSIGTIVQHISCLGSTIAIEARALLKLLFLRMPACVATIGSSLSIEEGEADSLMKVAA